MGRGWKGGGWDPTEQVGGLSLGEDVPGLSTPWLLQLWVGVSGAHLPQDSVKACPASLGLPSYQPHARTWKFGGGVGLLRLEPGVLVGCFFRSDT